MAFALMPVPCLPPAPQGPSRDGFHVVTLHFSQEGPWWTAFLFLAWSHLCESTGLPSGASQQGGATMTSTAPGAMTLTQAGLLALFCDKMHCFLVPEIISRYRQEANMLVCTSPSPSREDAQSPRAAEEW